MPSPRAPWTDRALRLLADGQWKDREWVIRRIAPLVPPGRAIRKTEWSRTRPKIEGVAVGPRKVPRSEDFQIASGQRHFAVKALNGASFETKREDGRVWIRLKSPMTTSEG